MAPPLKMRKPRAAHARGSVASHRRDESTLPPVTGRRGAEVDERAERIGLNESLFREVNERVRGINEAFSDILGDAEFVCECGQAECTDRIKLTLGDYERVRSEGTLFFVKP